jgi:hypothetical protein
MTNATLKAPIKQGVLLMVAADPLGIARAWPMPCGYLRACGEDLACRLAPKPRAYVTSPGPQLFDNAANDQ